MVLKIAGLQILVLVYIGVLIELYFGLSTPRVLNTDKNTEEGFEALDRLSYYFTGGVCC